jgi:two-component system LytT family response regulator
MAIRVMIVDDEPLARERLRGMVADEPDLNLIAECVNGEDAVATIRDQRPDVVFLDVQMPKLDGFGVLEKLGPEATPPVTIFVTAYDQYALKAFEVHAQDYLLKPFDRERFRTAVGHARQQLQRREATRINDKLASLLADVQQPRNKPLDRIMVKSAGRIYFLRLEEIDWIEAAGNYVRLHSGQDEHLLRETMNGLESKLDGQKFLRIHRSTIVNLERVQELQPLFHGDYVVILKNGTQLTMSRNYREKLQGHFGQLL